PREAASVAVIRHILDAALRTLGVVPAVRDDIQVILSEACSNVVRHAVRCPAYTVRAAVTHDRCLIQVTDEGEGFRVDGATPPPATAEYGRGLQITRALADHVHVTSAEHGSKVSVEKVLRFADDAPVHALECPLAAHSPV